MTTYLSKIHSYSKCFQCNFIMPSDDAPSGNRRCTTNLFRRALFPTIAFFFGLQLNAMKLLFRGFDFGTSRTLSPMVPYYYLTKPEAEDNNDNMFTESIMPPSSHTNDANSMSKLILNSKTSPLVDNDRRFIPRTNLPYDCGKSIHTRFFPMI